jgi:hypothetical protein
MKPGKSLVEMAKTLEDLRKNSRDFLVPSSKLEMAADSSLVFMNGEAHTFNPNSYAHSQVANYTGVPRQYYEKLKAEAPSLLADNVNHGFRKQAEVLGRNGKPETRMVRTYNGNVRALLSSSFRRLDSFDLCNEILPMMADSQMQVVSSELTESRLYLKALTPKLTAEVKKGDVVQYGLMISNSDVGAGSVRVEPMILRLVCMNGLISNTVIRKFHVGRNLAGDNIQELLSDETNRLTDAAFWAQIRDVVTASMNPKVFDLEVDRMRAATEVKITNFDIPEVVELAMSAARVTGEKTKDSIIAYLANGADGAGLTKWGLANGFTFAAQSDAIGYDQSIELERAGSKILDLNGNQWRRIAEAA